VNRVRRRRYLGAVAGSAATTGCLTDVLPDGVGPSPDAPPDLLVVAGGRTDGANDYLGWRLLSLSYDADEEAYATAAEYAEQPVAGLDSHAGEFAAVTLGQDSVSVRLLDRSLSTRTSVAVDEDSSLAFEGGTVYTASRQGLTVYDDELSRLGRATLPEAYSDKHMETVAVFDGNAYVVDDVMVPVYLFRADVADATAPAYAEVVNVSGVNISLDQQWFVPAENRWNCLVSAVTRGGASQSVLSGPMTGAPTVDGEGPVPVRSDDAVSTSEHYGWRSPDDEETGPYVDDVATTPPTYGTVVESGSYHLAALSADGGPLAVDERVDLGRAPNDEDEAFPGGEPTRIASGDGFVVVTATGDDETTLFVNDVERDSMVLEQDLGLSDVVEVQVVDG
jgi:hypothetical protein